LGPDLKVQSLGVLYRAWKIGNVVKMTFGKKEKKVLPPRKEISRWRKTGKRKKIMKRKRQTYRKIDRRTDRQTDRQTDKQTNRQTDKQTEMKEVFRVDGVSERERKEASGKRKNNKHIHTEREN
jgi:hypothetical protein